MGDRLEAKFKEKWPEFFRDVTCGFYLPIEWENLVWVLCSNIRWQLESRDLSLGAMQVLQVKEKFGGLRFYYHLDCSDGQAKAAVSATIMLAESLSSAPEYELKGQP